MSYAPSPPPPAQYGFTPPGAPVPLDAPYYGASLPVALRRYWKKYATFTGRASRSEFWWWVLCSAIVYLVIVGIGLAVGLAGATTDAEGVSHPGPVFALFPVLLACWYLATLVGNIAIAWRRLHDANLAGPFFFLAFIPSVGGIIMIVLTALSPNPAGARFDRTTTGS
jgi:Predicted membrane protein